VNRAHAVLSVAVDPSSEGMSTQEERRSKSNAPESRG
jgi:hypothetical protein